MPGRKAGARDVLPKMRRYIIRTLKQVDELDGGDGVVNRLTDAFIENPVAFMQATARFMPQEVHAEIQGKVSLIANIGSTTPQEPEPYSIEMTASSGGLEDQSVVASQQPVVGKSSLEHNEKDVADGV